MSTELFNSLAVRIMRDLLRDIKSWDVEDAAACVGNLGHETGGFRFMQELKPTIPGSAGGYGWAQWTGPRRRQFEAFCNVMRLEPQSYAANYGFLLEELRGSERATVPAVAKAPNLEAKTIMFEQKFERAGVKHYDKRLAWAKAAYNAYSRSLVSGPKEVPVSTIGDRPSKPPSAPKSPASKEGLIGLIVGGLAVAGAAVTAFFDRIASFFTNLFGG